MYILKRVKENQRQNFRLNWIEEKNEKKKKNPELETNKNLLYSVAFCNTEITHLSNELSQLPIANKNTSSEGFAHGNLFTAMKVLNKDKKAMAVGLCTKKQNIETQLQQIIESFTERTIKSRSSIQEGLNLKRSCCSC